MVKKHTYHFGVIYFSVNSNRLLFPVMYSFGVCFAIGLDRILEPQLLNFIPQIHFHITCNVSNSLTPLFLTDIWSKKWNTKSTWIGISSVLDYKDLYLSAVLFMWSAAEEMVKMPLLSAASSSFKCFQESLSSIWISILLNK